MVGRDPKVDLAVLKIDPGKRILVAVPFGNSDEARVGDWVLAIGNPFGLGGTVTAGIISPTGGSIGIGFAIPSSLAKPVIDDLKKYGKIHRGWLGVHIQSLDQDVADSLGLSSDKGAVVVKLSEGGPAAKADIRAGDVILKFDGKEIGEMRRLPRIVAETPTGKKVDVEIWRNNQKITLQVVVGEMKDEPDQDAKAEEKPAKSSAATALASLGLSVNALTPQLRDKFGLDDQINRLDEGFEPRQPQSGEPQHRHVPV